MFPRDVAVSTAIRNEAYLLPSLVWATVAGLRQAEGKSRGTELASKTFQNLSER